MKAITDGNYIVRPFVTHKTQTYGYAFLSGGNPAQVSIDLAVVPPTSSWQFASGSEPINPSGIYQRSLYESVKHVFYDDSTVDRVFQPTGSTLYVISIAQPAYGEQIRPGTFSLTEGTSIGTIIDDGNGGLIYSGSTSSSLFAFTSSQNPLSLGATFTGDANRTFRDTTGILRYAGLNVPRTASFIQNPTTKLLESVFLVESASTNQIVYSSNFENTAYWNNNMGVTASSIVSPDGTSLAAKLNVPSGSLGSNTTFVSRVGLVANNTATHSVSVFAKSAEFTLFDCMIAWASGSIGILADASTGNIINTTSRTSGNGVCITSRSVAYTNGWYRFDFSGVWTASVTTPLTGYFLLRSGSAGGATLTNGFSASGIIGMYAWGYQYEVGPERATSYIPTSGSAITRSSEYVDFPYFETLSNTTQTISAISYPTSGTASVSVSGSRLIPLTGFGYKSINVSRPTSSALVGNIFYENGVAVLNKSNRQLALSDGGLTLSTGSLVNVKFGATHTIYEHYIICTLDQGELNYSSHPSMKQLAADGLRVVDHMATGSLHPYMTQIGLYNDDGELMAIGKFPRPLKRAVGSQQTVIIRFDA